MKHAIYRFFAADGTLLYVGQSSDVTQRLHNHRFQSPWFDEIDTVKIQHVASRTEALEVEAAAIEAEQPRHNISRNRHSGGARLGRRPGHMIDRDATEQRLWDMGCRNASWLAARAGLSTAHVSNILRNRYAASSAAAHLIAIALECPVAELFPTMGLPREAAA